MPSSSKATITALVRVQAPQPGASIQILPTTRETLERFRENVIVTTWDRGEIKNTPYTVGQSSTKEECVRNETISEEC